jgi:LuxR family maltose regulon positive regulatory protein
MISAARGYLALAQGEIEVAITYTKNALTLFPQGENYNKEIVMIMLGLAQWTNGNLDDAYNTITRGTKNIAMEIMIAVVLAEISIEQGKFHQASLIYEKAINKLTNKGHLYQVMLASFYLGLGNIELQRGNLVEVDALLHKSEIYAKTGAPPNWQCKWYLLKAIYFESQCEFSKALDMYNKSELYYFNDPLPDTIPLKAAKVRVFLKQGNIKVAMEWIKKQHLTIEGELSYLREFEHITWIRVMIAEFRNFNNIQALGDAKRLIKRLLQEIIKGKRISKVIELYILQALVDDLCGELDLAIASLKNALKLGEAEEYIQMFIDEGLQLYQILSQIVAKETNSIYLLRLYEMFKESILLDKAEVNTSQQGIEKLTKREKEILLLIDEGLSNQEISERLFLALSTVKNYNRSLFGKLEVKSRTSAINKSRELGLI